MKAFYIDEFGKFIPYDPEAIYGNIFKFLYYKLPQGRVLIMAFIGLPGGINYAEIHKKACDLIIPKNQKPIGAGILYIRNKKIEFDCWESHAMEIVTPQKYQKEITEFFSNQY